MDRNLGAMDIFYHGKDGLHDGDLYYQFGRKDPFSGPRRIYIRKEDGIYSFETWSASTYTIPNTTADVNCNNVPYSIQHPLVFIKGKSSYWTYNDKYNPKEYESKIRWQDPYVMDGMGKSMFDPCPFGWKTPEKDTWTGFTTSNFLWNNPLSPGRNDPKSSAFYPASGFLTSDSCGFVYVGSYGMYWSCNPQSSDQRIKHLWFDSGSNVGQSYIGYRSCGLPVRCVLE